MLTPARSAPSTTITAPATAPVVTSRPLVVAVSERTAQRLHRGYRPASRMGRSAHHDLARGTMTGEPMALARTSGNENVGHLTAITSCTP